MFEELSQRFDQVFRKFRGRGTLTPGEHQGRPARGAPGPPRGDVNYKVAKDFVKGVEARATGAEVLQGLHPGQQVVKVVHDEMVRLLGEQHRGLATSSEGPLVVHGLRSPGFRQNHLLW